MFGVILWTDPKMGTAVIWCEDHGELAYYTRDDTEHSAAEPFFDAGDYVRFEVTGEGTLRRARNAQTVQQGGFASLPSVLQEWTVPADARTPGTAQIVDLCQEIEARAQNMDARLIQNA